MPRDLGFLKIMESVDAVLSRMRLFGAKPAIFWRSEQCSFADLFSMADRWNDRLREQGVGEGAVCGVVGDYSPQCCSLFIALIRARAILVPFTIEIQSEIDRFVTLGGVEHLFTFAKDDSWVITSLPETPLPDLIGSFRERQSPGLIVFTSGSTGQPKGILHDIDNVMKKFVTVRDEWRTVLFLLMDHFGGFNTLLSAFANGGGGVCVEARTPDAVCAAIEQTRATLLPTTPTFLAFLASSGSFRHFDLSSIRLITYGTEVMPVSMLQQVRTMFPAAQLKQTYGLSELGVLRSRSESDESLWVKVGGAGFEVKVVDNVLWVRAESNMVGYLNAPSPFDKDGWLCTGDEVEMNGEFLRFLGRKAEVINVGGQKVFPAEIEAVLLEDPNVMEASVYGVPHPLMGQVAEARVSLRLDEDPAALAERLRSACIARMARYKMPMRFHVVRQEELSSPRFKKVRQPQGGH